MAFLGPSLRRKRVTERPAARIAVAALASLALNALLFLVVARLGAFDLAGPPATERVELAPLSADQWSANRAIAGLPPAMRLPVAPPPISAPVPAQRPPEASPPTPPPPRRDEELPGRLVQVAPSKDATPPKDSRFVSDRDNSVEKETRSRFAGTKKFANLLPSPSEGTAKPKQEAGEGGNADRTRQAKTGPDVANGTGAEKASTPGGKPHEEQQQLALAERPHEPGLGGLLQPRGQRSAPAPAPGDEGLSVPGAPGPPGEASKKSGEANLLPSTRSMAAITGGPSPDDLRDMDIEEGDGTYLNTRFYKYATFYNRIFESVYEQWKPSDAYQARDPRGTTFPLRDRRTTISMTLDASGQLTSVEVIQSSGLDFLDREIVRAVHAAAPFPNVPAALVKDGQVRIPPSAWTLRFEAGGGIHVQVGGPPQLPSQRPFPE